jgi:hypothetical protein
MQGQERLNRMVVEPLGTHSLLQVVNEEIQQQLLRQHSNLMSKARALMASIEEDVRSLARLWQLQAKMQSVGSTYNERLTQVALARSRVQEQLCKRLELLEGYCRIGSMIEIEVEMNTEVCKLAIMPWNIGAGERGDVRAERGLHIHRVPYNAYC